MVIPQSKNTSDCTIIAGSQNIKFFKDYLSALSKTGNFRHKRTVGCQEKIFLQQKEEILIGVV